MVIIDNNKMKLFKGLWQRIKEDEGEPSITEEKAKKEEEPQEEKEPDPIEKILSRQSYDLWKKWKELKEESTNGWSRLDFYHFALAPVSNGEELVLKSAIRFISTLEQIAQKTLSDILDMEMKKQSQEEKIAEAAYQEATATEEEKQKAKKKEELKKPEEFLKPIPATAVVDVADGSMTAYVVLIPPFFGGKEVEVADVQRLMKQQRVINGVLEEEIGAIVSEKKYFQVFLIARGQDPVFGKDGWVEELYPRASEMTIQEDENGVVDFKNLNMIQNIKKDTVICNIILPTKGEVGHNVRGEPVPTKDGKQPLVPRGKDTVISADGTKLQAAIDGYLSFEHGKFRVANRLDIDGNVDNSIGNIFFLGDIVIKGDVFNGFSVKATGNIHVKGMVEGALLKAGGSIIVEKGINGNKQGSVEAQGDLESKFLENCTVYAGGCIKTESIIWSEVNCDDKIEATKNKGVIIGGSITAKTSVEAKIIGNKSNQKTVITLGYSPKLLQEKKDTEDRLKETVKMLEEIKKNVSFLEKRKESLPLEKQKQLKQLGLQKILYEKKKKSLDLKAASIAAEMSDLSDCRLKSGTIFPDTKVVIGFCNKTISAMTSRCNIYLHEGEITIGTY